jgi:hypothetical protein
MSLRLERIAEEKIQQAMKDGLFDNLAGFGKPINWKDNPFVPEDWKMAFDLLEKNGYKLPWMDKRIEIEEEYKQAVRTCEQNLIYQPARARAEFFTQVEAINRKIFDYNLMVPSVHFQKLNYNVREIFQQLKNKKNG